MENNLEFYDKLKEVPENAKKPIQAGRLRGMTDINPMWRIKRLTEVFGPCGLGWKYEIKNKEIYFSENNEQVAIVDILLYVKYGNTWSEAIPGTGGSMLVAKESGGLHTNDEAFKMALTDAISVASKALGLGATVYWEQDKTKYLSGLPNKNENKKQNNSARTITEAQFNRLMKLANNDKELIKKVMNNYGFTNPAKITMDKYEQICEEVTKGAN